MQIMLHEAAEAEMLEAAGYYEERASGLGLSFLGEVETMMQTVLTHPEAYQRVGNELRRAILKKFPYSLLYAIESDRIRVIAVAHQKRRPGYWLSRLISPPGV